MEFKNKLEDYIEEEFLSFLSEFFKHTSGLYGDALACTKTNSFNTLS